MVDGSGARRLLFAACAVTVFGSLTGFGLGRFATGGATVELVGRDTEEPQLGRPEALIPDRAESGYVGTPAIVPTVCEGCGPGLQERKAMAQAREVDERIARHEAMLAEAAATPWQPEDDVPGLRSFDELGKAAPVLPRLAGASAQMGEPSAR